MKTSNFKIKISDLLLNPGTSDTIFFENKFSQELPFLDSKGISGEIFLQSLDTNSLLVTINNLNCILIIPCDFCGNSFQKEINIKNYISKFVNKNFFNKEDIDPEEEFYFEKDSIDIHDLVVQAILLEQNISNICEICKNKEIKETEDKESGNKVNFINIK